MDKDVERFLDCLMELDKEERTAILTVVVNQLSVVMPKQFERMKMLIQEMKIKGKRISREDMYKRIMEV